MRTLTVKELSIIPVMVIAIAGFLYLERSTGIRQPEMMRVPARVPDFGSYTDVKIKKQDFFSFILPMIRNANSLVSAERQFLLTLSASHSKGLHITSRQQETLQYLAQRYRHADMPFPQSLPSLLEKIDTVPASLIMAQAANESAWGTSRFAREGNNYFGIWCFSSGCGQIPNARDTGKTHEVARFQSIQKGVEHYLLTINSHPAYQRLRDLRAESRHIGAAPLGSELAEGLLEYSERGLPYMRDIQAMIRINQLHRFTRHARG